MNRPKLTAMITGAIALLLSVIYLVVVQLLDLRTEFVPAPIEDVAIATCTSVHTSTHGFSRSRLSGSGSTLLGNLEGLASGAATLCSVV